VNVAYSALVRDPSADRFARMTALKIERRAIMSLLFGGAWREHRRHPANGSDLTAVDQDGNGATTPARHYQTACDLFQE
jgi:hypothetical protein